MKKGYIIFLHGVSSAGKTTLARELQNKLDDVFYWLANDTFVDMVPYKCWDMDPSKYSFQALLMLNKAIKMFSDEEKNVIVDHVMLRSEKQDLFKDVVTLLHDYPILLVKVVCPIHELERREKERGDRDIGQAVGQLPQLNPQDGYDIVVDTFNNSTVDCAKDIIKALYSDTPRAIKQIHSTISSLI